MTMARASSPILQSSFSSEAMHLVMASSSTYTSITSWLLCWEGGREGGRREGGGREGGREGGRREERRGEGLVGQRS